METLGVSTNKLYLKTLRPHVKEDFFFVNIGANDGVSEDPIFPFIKKFGWKGIEVEPVLETFNKLKQNLSAVEGIIFENVAIGQKGREIFCFSEEHTSLHPSLSRLNSFSREHIDNFLDALDKNMISHPDAQTDHPTGDSLRSGLRSVFVQSIGFNELMEKHHVKRVDFINIDTEKDDFDILMSIDMDKYAPVLLCIETNTFDKDQKKKFDELMQKYNYSFLLTYDLVSEVFVRNK